MKALLILLAACLVATTASAQLNAGFGGIKSEIANKSGDTDDISQMFAELEYQMEVGSYWMGVVTGYDAVSESNSFGVRWYFDFVDGNGAYPGIGVAVFDIASSSSDLLEEDVLLVGPELLLEFSVPLGDQDVPALALIGYYPEVRGDQGSSLVRFGARVNAPLFE